MIRDKGQKSLDWRDQWGEGSVTLEGQGLRSEIWMLKLAVQEVEKFRATAKPGCDGKGQRRKFKEFEKVQRI